MIVTQFHNLIQVCMTRDTSKSYNVMDVDSGPWGVQFETTNLEDLLTIALRFYLHLTQCYSFLKFWLYK